MEDLTHLLEAVRAGDRRALGQIFSVTYDELCRLARRQLRKVSADSALDTTSLVHECYLRLARAQRLVLYDRAHFLGYAARVMRSIVVDCAREAFAQRRSMGTPLVTAPVDIPDHEAVKPEELLLLGRALAELACSQERLAQIVGMRYFLGFTVEEVARSLGVTGRTIRRDWERARSLLSEALQ
jgi:RNA polymerase sigma factor (TIGR02999 family)